MAIYSKTGVALALIYIASAAYLIAIQGLFGESFIAIMLGLPWSLGLSYFEYFGADGAALVFFLVMPMALNALIFYWIGTLISRLFPNRISQG